MPEGTLSMSKAEREWTVGCRSALRVRCASARRPSGRASGSARSNGWCETGGRTDTPDGVSPAGPSVASGHE